MPDPDQSQNSSNSVAVMENAEIQRVLPHRYPFLLIDRVVEITPRERIVAVKNVTANEPFFMGHFPGFPIMPGVLIVEAIAGRAEGTSPDAYASFWWDSVDDVVALFEKNGFRLFHRKPFAEPWPGEQLCFKK